jgi:hypothetical protein
MHVTKTEYIAIQVKAIEIVDYIREQGFIPEGYKVRYVAAPEYGFGTPIMEQSFRIDLERTTELGGKK